MFNDCSQQLVHALKYRDRHEVVRSMARMMVHAGRDVIAGADVIVPVPLHRWRLWSRRYNQAALLASEIGGLADIKVETGADQPAAQYPVTGRSRAGRSAAAT